MSKICVWCGKEYEPQTKRSSYCTKECANQARLKRQRDYQKRKKGTPEKKNCIICGKELVSAHGNSKVCSDECAAEHRKRIQHDYYEQNKTQKIQKCVICGKEFEPHSRTLTCSNECRKKQQEQWYKERLNTVRKKIIRNCVVCGKEFESQHNMKVCSMKCREIRDKQTDKAFYEKYKAIAKQKKKERIAKARGEVCQVEVEHRKLDGKVLHRAEMTVDEYNRTHGTNYSYGQYVHYVESKGVK